MILSFSFGPDINWMSAFRRNPSPVGLDDAPGAGPAPGQAPTEPEQIRPAETEVGTVTNPPYSLKRSCDKWRSNLKFKQREVKVNRALVGGGLVTAGIVVGGASIYSKSLSGMAVAGVLTVEGGHMLREARKEPNMTVTLGCRWREKVKPESAPSSEN